MIELASVTKDFGDKLAVDRLSLAVAPGELVAFLGPNGAGKTTTIKMICGLLRPTDGAIRVAGLDVAQQGRQVRHCLGYVPDEPYLYDRLTGREFLRFVADIYEVPSAESEARINEQVATFELAPFVDQLVMTYSHGMSQRLVFASVFLRDLRALVVDEPLVGLDPKSVRLVKDLLRRRARAGCAVLMSTHTLAIAEEVADRIAILDRGRLIACGTLSEIQRMAAMHGPLEDLFLHLTAHSDELGVGQPG